MALALLATAAAAQPVYNGPIYNGLDDDPYEQDAQRGVRIGVGVGPYIYSGPYYNGTGGLNDDDALATNLAVTGEVSFPLVGQLYGRVLGGLLNIGADDDLVDAEFNPFLTSQTILAEGDLMYYVTPPRKTGLSPYVFAGLSGLFATGDAADGVETTALAIPVGLGLEYGISRNLSLFAEGSYRFGLTDVAPRGFAFRSPAGAFAVAATPDVCDKTSPNFDEAACDGKGGKPFCPDGQVETPSGCREVGDDGDGDNERFNSGLILGGLRLGFGDAPARPRVPAYVPPAYVPEPVAPVAPQVPLVCDLVELNSVYFGYGTGTLDRRSQSLLDENVELLLSNPACCVFIDGYTDTPEGDRFGMGLAGRRAQAVYDYYLSRGVGASRLQIRNRGVAVPNCDKEDPGPGCERNRRVESLPVDCERFQFLLENPSYDPY